MGPPFFESLYQRSSCIVFQNRTAADRESWEFHSMNLEQLRGWNTMLCDRKFNKMKSIKEEWLHIKQRSRSTGPYIINAFPCCDGLIIQLNKLLIKSMYVTHQNFHNLLSILFKQLKGSQVWLRREAIRICPSSHFWFSMHGEQGVPWTSG